MSVTITTGAPVDVTLEDDGTLTVHVYLGEVADADDAEVSDAQRAAIAAAVTAGRVTVHADAGA